MKIFFRIAYYVSAQHANLQLSWLRILLYQCAQSWGLLQDEAVPVDTPLRSPRGRRPGWSVYLYVVAIRLGDTDVDRVSLVGWVDANRPLLR